MGEESAEIPEASGVGAVVKVPWPFVMAGESGAKLPGALDRL